MTVPLLALQSIDKYFAGKTKKALAGADFQAQKGEIHALLGENGAGKSTLMHIAAGYLKPDAGRLVINGVPVSFSSPSDALKAGIGMVTQYPQATAGFMLWEDCTLGTEQSLLLDRKKARRLVQEYSCRFAFDLPVDAFTDTLSISQRQKAAVLALLLRKAEYFIFDEPTAVLAPVETQRLFSLFQTLKTAGAGIILISHKLDETLALADRVTVLRQGKTVLTGNPRSFDRAMLNACLFGEDASLQFAERTRKSVSTAAPAVLRVNKLSVEAFGAPFLRTISCEVRAGTIVAVLGVRDSGLRTFEYALTGQLPIKEGSVVLAGTPLTGSGIRAFRRSGGAYLSSDGSAAAPALPLRDTLLIHLHRHVRGGLLGRLGIMDRAWMDKEIKALMEEAGVVCNPRARTDSCSGGMLQRLVLARELAEKSCLLVLSEPGKGLDRPSRERLCLRLRAYGEQEHKPAVLIFSTDLDELAQLADEILVLHNGSITERLKTGADRERIIAAMTA
ncbi:MAG: ATP-binding cassette domain-containing protein [Spirochaetaceae bacterium]|jgi:simple sugar transport system ATP-binding protein|nr:ATP-binding cassette domain-containing protein [Spirochaetaceae bacterium]